MASPPPRNGQVADGSRSESPLAQSERLAQTIGNAFARIAPDLERVEAALRDTLQSKSALIPVLGEHLLSSGGKRLRPALVLLAAELCGYVGPRRIELAAALELLHTATLLHDDIVDLAELRRGRPSANAIWAIAARCSRAISCMRARRRWSSRTAISRSSRATRGRSA
jgi:hypothetical protein